jgi:hypothetical protein
MIQRVQYIYIYIYIIYTMPRMPKMPYFKLSFSQAVAVRFVRRPVINLLGTTPPYWFAGRTYKPMAMLDACNFWLWTFFYEWGGSLAKPNPSVSGSKEIESANHHHHHFSTPLTRAIPLHSPFSPSPSSLSLPLSLFSPPLLPSQPSLHLHLHLHLHRHLNSPNTTPATTTTTPNRHIHFFVALLFLLS